MLTDLKKMLVGRILRQSSVVNAFDSLIVEVACPDLSTSSRVNAFASRSFGRTCPEGSRRIEGPSRNARINVAWKNSLVITTLIILVMGSALQAMDVAIVGQSDVDRFMNAVAWWNLEVMNELITKGVNVNAKDKYGRIPLIQAARHNAGDVCELLIAHGADIDATFEGNTALGEATWRGHMEICKLLIANKANVNAQNEYDRTALMKAASYGHNRICEFLLANGADVNKQDEDCKTALIFAATNGNKKTCELLIKAMIKLTDQERTEVSTLLSLKKRRVAGLHSESKKVIAFTRLDDIKREKRQNAREQIMKITDEKMRKDLLDYLNSIK